MCGPGWTMNGQAPYGRLVPGSTVMGPSAATTPKSRMSKVRTRLPLRSAPALSEPRLGLTSLECRVLARADRPRALGEIPLEVGVESRADHVHLGPTTPSGHLAESAVKLLLADAGSS